MRSPHFWAVVLVLVLTITFVQFRGDTDRVPVSEPLSQLPMSIGPWAGSDAPLASYVFDVLGKGVFLNRTYSYEADDSHVQMPAHKLVTAPVGLFIGYFPTQRTGQAIHSPQNCLPGAGWTFESKGVIELTDQVGKRYRVGDYLISNGTDKDEVLYWYRSHGRTIASDYAAKWYTLTDSILHHRTDAALVRVITPLKPGENRVDAQRRVVGFASRISALLPAYIPD